MKKTKISIMLILTIASQLILFPLVSYAANYIANDFTKSTPTNTTLNFTAQDFLNVVDPPSGNPLTAVRFTQLTNARAGTLRIGADAVALNTTIPISKMDQLNFVPVKDYQGEAIFTWTAVFGNNTSPYPGAVIITIGDGVTAPLDSATAEPDASEPPSEPPSETPDASEEPQSSATPEPTGTPEPTETPEPTATPEPEPTLKPLKYEDMDDHWGAYSAGLLATKGYIVGEEIQDRFFFYPDKVLSRIDFVIMINSIFGVEPKDSTADNPFADQNIPSYILRYAIASYEAGIINGSDEGGILYLHPYDKITRVEATKILDNALKLEYPNTEDPEFTDNASIPEWGIQAVKNMEGYGIIRGFEDNTFRPYSNITKAQAAEMLYQTLKYVEKVRKTHSVFNFVQY